jgi:hypothetical protein
VNEAVTLRAASSVTLQLAVEPWQAPPHALKVLPAIAVAVSCTCEPAA